MAKEVYPISPAIRVLRDKKIEFVPHLYPYVEKGGTRQTSIELKVEEFSIIKTLVMESEDGKPFFILMHGDKEVSTKELARQIGSKTVKPCDANKATKATGYEFGGTSPFGSRTNMKVYAEASIFDIDKIYINGGKRGFIVEIKSSDIKLALAVQEVNVAI